MVSCTYVEGREGGYWSPIVIDNSKDRQGFRPCFANTFPFQDVMSVLRSRDGDYSIAAISKLIYMS